MCSSMCSLLAGIGILGKDYIIGFINARDVQMFLYVVKLGLSAPFSGSLFSDTEVSPNNPNSVKKKKSFQ